MFGGRGKKKKKRQTYMKKKVKKSRKATRSVLEYQFHAGDTETFRLEYI